MYLHISLYIMYIIYIINSLVSGQQSLEITLKTKLLEAESSPAVPTALGTWIHFPLCPFLANQRELSQHQLHQICFALILFHLTKISWPGCKFQKRCEWSSFHVEAASSTFENWVIPATAPGKVMAGCSVLCVMNPFEWSSDTTKKPECVYKSVSMV